METARPVALDRSSVRRSFRALVLLGFGLATAAQGEDAGAGPVPAAPFDAMAVSPPMRNWVERVLGDGPADDGSTSWALHQLRRLRRALTQAGPASMVE